MPPFSDPPYPFNCLLNGFASTFERYQFSVYLPVRYFQFLTAS